MTLDERLAELAGGDATHYLVSRQTQAALAKAVIAYRSIIHLYAGCLDDGPMGKAYDFTDNTDRALSQALGGGGGDE
jgi:hypothetical protein